MTLKEFYISLKAIDIQTIIEDAVWENKDYIVELNQSQLHQGLTSKGTAIHPLYRSKTYAEYKASLSTYDAPNWTPDLFLTGAFYKSFGLEIGNGEYDIYSNDSKADDLTKKYADILGLTSENLEKVKINVTNTFVNLLKEKLNI